MALRLRGATSGYIELKAPASAGDNTLTLPTNNGSANQLLKTDGSGNLSWADDNSGVSLSGSTNNTIATVTGANALIGEANLTFNGSGDLTVKGNDGISANLYLIADRGDDNGDGWRIGSNQDTNDLTVANNTTGSYVDKITLLKTGEVGISVNPSSGQMLAITGRSGYDDIVQVTAVGTNMGARINLTNTGTGVARLNATNNSLELQTSGSPRLRILSDGKVGIGTTSPDRTLNITSVTGGNCDVELKAANNTGWCQLLFSDTDAAFRGGIGYEHQNNYMAFYTGAQEERLRIDSTGAVGLGITTPKDNDGNYRQLQIGLGAHFYGRTDDTPLYLLSNGYRDSSTWKYTANTTASRMGLATNIIFKTAVSGTAGNAISWQDRMTIYNSTGDVELHAGNLKLASGKGVMFHPHDESVSTPGSDSNLLDDYEEGTFLLSFGTSGTNFSTNPTLSQNNCRYTKIGNTVTISAYVGWGNQGAGGSGDLRIAGLPFTQNSAAVYNGAYFGWYAFGGGFDADTILQAYVSNGSTYLTLLKTTTGDTSPSYATVPHSAVVGLTGTYQLSMTYTV